MPEIRLFGNVVKIDVIPVEESEVEDFVQRVKHRKMDDEELNILKNIKCREMGLKPINTVFLDALNGIMVFKRKLLNVCKSGAFVEDIEMPPYLTVKSGVYFVVRENVCRKSFGKVFFNIPEGESFNRRRIYIIGILNSMFSKKRRILLSENSFYYIPKAVVDDNNLEKFKKKVYREMFFGSPEEKEYTDMVDFFDYFRIFADKIGLIEGVFRPQIVFDKDKVCIPESYSYSLSDADFGIIA